MDSARTTRWQALTLVTLFVGYAGYYLCRSNLSVAAPLLKREIDQETIGLIASAGVLLYALGKVTNGVLVDFLGGRGLFLAGMVVSVVCTAGFGIVEGSVAFIALWSANRYAQSAGWGALVKTASRWYPVSAHALIMGILSMSYLLGDALGRWYLGLFVGAGVGWRPLFLIAAGTLAGIALVSCFTLRSSPRDVGLPEPPANPHNVFGAAGDLPEPESLGRLLRPLLTNLTFWLVCVMSFGLTLIRETFNLWVPTYLHQIAGLSEGEAARSSSVFPLLGAVSAALAGFLAGRLQGMHGRVIVPGLIGLVVALGLLGVMPPGNPTLSLVLIGAVSFFLIGPYSFLAGVAALDLGGKRGSSTAAGLIDSAGYVGAILSGSGIASLTKHHGWPVAFGGLAVVAALSLLAAAVYWLRQEASLRAPRFIS